MDHGIFDPGNQGLGNEEIIDSPAYAALAGIEYVRPPRVLDTIGVQMTIYIDKSVVEEFLYPCPLLWQETRGFLVRF